MDYDGRKMGFREADCRYAELKRQHSWLIPITCLSHWRPSKRFPRPDGRGPCVIAGPRRWRLSRTPRADQWVEGRPVGCCWSKNLTISAEASGPLASV